MRATSRQIQNPLGTIAPRCAVDSRFVQLMIPRFWCPPGWAGRNGAPALFPPGRFRSTSESPPCGRFLNILEWSGTCEMGAHLMSLYHSIRYGCFCHIGALSPRAHALHSNWGFCFPTDRFHLKCIAQLQRFRIVV